MKLDFKQLIAKYKSLPTPEKVAWGAIGFGVLLIILSVFLF
tara:strand:+ start:1771 stop:1893 length:123 start_codon:yes stop_codon:yes gene_type:complete